MSSELPDPWMMETFTSATIDFNSRLTDDQKIDFSRFASIDAVYAETQRIQAEQAKSGKLRSLDRISPYIAWLRQYEPFIEQFVQVKPEIMALIWVCVILGVFN